MSLVVKVFPLQSVHYILKDPRSGAEERISGGLMSTEPYESDKVAKAMLKVWLLILLFSLILKTYLTTREESDVSRSWSSYPVRVTAMFDPNFQK